MWSIKNESKTNSDYQVAEIIQMYSNVPDCENISCGDISMWLDKMDSNFEILDDNKAVWSVITVDYLASENRRGSCCWENV